MRHTRKGVQALTPEGGFKKMVFCCLVVRLCRRIECSSQNGSLLHVAVVAYAISWSELVTLE